MSGVTLGAATLATPDVSRLGFGAVHVWQASIEDTGPLSVVLERLLDGRESERVASFRRPVDRQRYIGAHGVLRLLLGAYLGRKPEAVNVGIRSGGKPSLAGPARLTGLVFNLSYDADVVLVGLSRFAHVGVDVQSHATPRRVDLLSETALTDAERAWLADRGGRSGRQDVVRLWARKEAVVKATGLGMGSRLSEIDVSGDAPVVVSRPNGRSGASLVVRDLDVGADFSAAVATSPWCRRLERRTWPAR